MIHYRIKFKTETGTHIENITNTDLTAAIQTIEALYLCNITILKIKII